MSTAFFAPGYLRLLYRFLQLPADKEALLFGSTGVTGEELMHAAPEITFTTQMQLCRNALSISPPGLGLRMGGKLQLAAHGVLGTAMQNAATLEQALQVLADYGATRASFFAITKHLADNECTVALTFDGLDEDLVPFFSESILSTMSLCLDFFAGANNVGQAFYLSHASPVYGAEYEQFFQSPVTFNAGFTGMRFPREYLNLTSLDGDEALFRDAIYRCQLELEKRNVGNGYCDSVEQFLRGNPGKLWKLEEIADVLHTSKRTLIRRLRREETSYQALRDKVLQAQATTCLHAMSVASTAAALGFADESSFRRTFRRWFGVSPTEYRERQRRVENVIDRE